MHLVANRMDCTEGPSASFGDRGAKPHQFLGRTHRHCRRQGRCGAHSFGRPEPRTSHRRSRGREPVRVDRGSSLRHRNALSKKVKVVLNALKTETEMSMPRADSLVVEPMKKPRRDGAQGSHLQPSSQTGRRPDPNMPPLSSIDIVRSEVNFKVM